ncbi:phosphate signaling complex protein PhoU [Brackiella oedipodis]|uniref:phosphate signaling complex protein PhoU n=1 Tax=Brackiella oedipodis TaxID=124225 RepID=UPI00056E2E53|nr:phosphate signaling complex protein PhoU [Brackiella oedipodis]
MEHTNKSLGQDLDEIRSSFLRMGGIVESMIQDAVIILNTGDLSLVDKVKEREKEVNQLEIDIDSTIARVLALQQPTAIDLRLLLSVSKMLTDLERSADEADKISKTARRMFESNSQYETIIELDHMGVNVAKMLQNVLDAFARYDAIAAAEVVRSDKKIDKEWKGVLRSASSFMIEDPRLISSCIDLMFIARSLERIGDHSKNMAERVIYLVQGEDVRHTGVKNAESVARNEGPATLE